VTVGTTVRLVRFTSRAVGPLLAGCLGTTGTVREVRDTGTNRVCVAFPGWARDGGGVFWCAPDELEEVA